MGKKVIRIITGLIYISINSSDKKKAKSVDKSFNNHKICFFRKYCRYSNYWLAKKKSQGKTKQDSDYVNLKNPKHNKS